MTKTPMDERSNIAENIARWTQEALEQGKPVQLSFDAATGEWTKTRSAPVPFSIRRHLAGESNRA